MRAAEGPVEIARASGREDDIAGSPDDPGRDRRTPEERFDAGERIGREADGIGVDQPLALFGRDERSEIDVDRLVGEPVGEGEGQTAQPFGRARQRFVGHPGREPGVGEPAGACQLDHRQHGRRRTVDLHVAVGEQHRSHPLRVADREELGHRAAAVARDEIDRVDPEAIEKLDEHLDLGVRRDARARRDLGRPEPEKIRRDAPADVPEAVERTPPLITGEREAVNEEGDGAGAALHVGNPAEPTVGEPARGVPGGGGVESGLGGCGRPSVRVAARGEAGGEREGDQLGSRSAIHGGSFRSVGGTDEPARPGFEANDRTSGRVASMPRAVKDR